MIGLQATYNSLNVTNTRANRAEIGKMKTKKRYQDQHTPTQNERKARLKFH